MLNEQDLDPEMRLRRIVEYGKVAAMKTTVELSDDLVFEAKRYAARHGMTLRAVIEHGIRSTLRAEGGAVKPFTLRDASVDGTGLQAEFRDESWSTMREAAYGGGR
ncbi:MAG: DUF2191 domain-containing protein [Acidobacteria bacterium]|nr:DUF2191 domain-containing protein [Acidobacteriota bacterium]